MAHRKALETGKAWVIVILYNITEEELFKVADPDIKKYLKYNTYIKWGDPYFWTKLNKALRKRKRFSWHKNTKRFGNNSDNNSDSFSNV